MSTPATYQIVQGFADDYPTQTYLWGSTSPAQYGAGDVLVGYCIPAGMTLASAIFQPLVDWYTVGGQTGYDQGQVLISISNAQSLLLVPTINYTLLVGWAAAATPAKISPIARVKLCVLPVALL
jgi:hypothetical protein